VLTFVSHQVASAIERKRNEEALLRSETRYRSLCRAPWLAFTRQTQRTLPRRKPRAGRNVGLPVGGGTARSQLAAAMCLLMTRSKAAVHQSFPARRAIRRSGSPLETQDGAVITVRLSGRGVRDEREGAEVSK